MFAPNKSSQTKRTADQEKEHQQNQKIRETLKKINLQVISEDDQFEVFPENFTE